MPDLIHVLTEKIDLNVFGHVFLVLVLQIASILNFVLIFLLFHKKVYHLNLRLLLINVSATFVFTCVSQSTVLWMEMLRIESWNGADVVKKLVTVGTWSMSLNMPCLFCERLLAVLWDAKYEAMFAKFPWPALLLIALNFSISFIIVVVNCATESLVLAAIVVKIFALATFSWMPSFAVRRYETAIAAQFSLSQRFQTSENVRSSKMLFRVLWILGGFSIASELLYCLGKYIFQTFAGSRIQLIFGILYMVQAVLYPLLVISNVKVFKNSLLKHFCCFNCCRKKVDNVFAVESITGLRLVIVDVDQQRDSYFQEYQKSWN